MLSHQNVEEQSKVLPPAVVSSSTPASFRHSVIRSLPMRLALFLCSFLKAWQSPILSRPNKAVGRLSQVQLTRQRICHKREVHGSRGDTLGQRPPRSPAGPSSRQHKQARRKQDRTETAATPNSLEPSEPNRPSSVLQGTPPPIVGSAVQCEVRSRLFRCLLANPRSIS